ncbi:Phosphatidylinositol glycan anchor biosynthesis class U [Carabus blaptoides fortunei]
MTTTVFHNFFISLYIYALIHRKPLLGTLSLAVSTTHTLYSAILILPVLLNLKDEKYARYKMSWYFILFLTFILGIECVSSVLCGSWKFIENTFGFILLIPDLQPNIGLFWYFFTEMFEHFRALFISAFQINAIFLYLIPLCIRFKKDPVMLASSLIILSTIFKSYPSLGDVGFCLALLPMWTHLVSYLQQGFFVSCCFLISTVLGPVVWHLWIYSRSANANFYFGVTLSFATAQIFLITDLLFAYIKIEFWLKNSHVQNTDSKSAKLTLE